MITTGAAWMETTGVATEPAMAGNQGQSHAAPLTPRAERKFRISGNEHRDTQPGQNRPPVYLNCHACGGKSLYTSRWTTSLRRCSWCHFVNNQRIVLKVLP